MVTWLRWRALPFEKGDAQGLMQPPGLCFRIGGVDRRRANEEWVQDGCRDARAEPADGLQWPGEILLPLGRRRALFRDDELLVPARA